MRVANSIGMIKNFERMACTDAKLAGVSRED